MAIDTGRIREGTPLHTLLYKYLIVKNRRVPEESLLLDLLVKLSQLSTFNRLKVSWFKAETFTNIYAIKFMGSGKGKDRPPLQIEEDLFGTYKDLFKQRAVEFKERTKADLEKEAAERGIKANAGKVQFIEQNRARGLKTKISGGTAEGFISDRESFFRAGFGGTFVSISEFGDYITALTTQREQFLSVLVEVFDMGNNNAMSIKSEKDAISVEGVPSVALLNSSLAGLRDGHSSRKLREFLSRGMGRRSLICKPLDEAVPEQKEELDMRKVYLEEKALFLASKEAIPEARKAINNVLYIPQGTVFQYTEDAEMMLLEYEKTNEIVTDWMDSKAEEAFIAEIGGRTWKVLKLSGIIAMANHPDKYTVEPEDVQLAIYIVDLFGTHYQSFFIERELTAEEKIVNMFLRNAGVWFGRYELRSLGYVSHQNFKRWWDDVYEEVEIMLNRHGLRFETRQHGRSGLAIRAIRVEQVEGKVIHLSVSKDTAKDFLYREFIWEEIHKVVMTNINYSPSKFHKNYRNNENFVEGNDVAVLDFDGEMSLAQIRKYLAGNNIKAFVATTRNHLKEKNGTVGERFRLILPMASKFKGNADDFRATMVELFKTFDNKCDTVAKDPARFYYGNPDGSYFYFTGDLLDWPAISELSFGGVSYKTKEETEGEDGVITYKKKAILNPDISDEGAITQWFKNNAVQGNRNSTLYKAKLFALDHGKNPHDYVNKINNMLKTPLDEREIAIILRENYR